MDKNNVIRAILKLCLGPIGSLIINKTSLKIEGAKSRTLAHLFLPFVTCSVYHWVAGISAFFYNPEKEKNIGYKKED